MPHIGIFLKIILFDISECGNYPQNEKRSVFGIIENIRIDGKENTSEEPDIYDCFDRSVTQ